MRIQKTLNHGNTRWRVTISLHGKRRQRFFTSRDEARAWLNSIEADSTGFWCNRTPRGTKGHRLCLQPRLQTRSSDLPMHIELPCQTDPPFHNRCRWEVCQGHQTAITTPFVSQTNPTTPLTTGRTVLQSDVPQGFIKPAGGMVPHPKLEAIHH